MKKIEQLSLNKEVIASLQNVEMSHIAGGDTKLNLSDIVIQSINTEFTQIMSCCGGTDCIVHTCKC